MPNSSVHRLFVPALVIICLAHFLLLAKAGPPEVAKKPFFYLNADYRSGKLIFKEEKSSFIVSFGIGSDAYWKKNPKQLTIKLGDVPLTFIAGPETSPQRSFTFGEREIKQSVFGFKFERANADGELKAKITSDVFATPIYLICKDGCSTIYKNQSTDDVLEYSLDAELIGDPNDNNNISPDVIFYSLESYESYEIDTTTTAAPAPSGSKPIASSLSAVELVVGGNLLLGLHQFLAI